ncbi:hypothetical protein EII14_01915 [Alloprevotella sp. OH1205_COT-284]|uniref:hypothetical protein n=1 Tax=Alloprevotella sp. OH1205_COT-284 TaxID=2491043 RepID=UPI000F5D5281|nr:hypothetical protein [Alloprevotella sp. OH1205_COT-284]RRD80569.1 hypothetical protein EII14_01915 [Alloprevotella sp. OH1205_COT-284]
MKNTFSKWIKPGALGVFALMAFAACSEDHFEIKDTGLGEQTLWESIKSNPELTDFADILQRTRVMKSENDNSSQLKAGELLTQMQSFTLWAPLNNTYNAKAWKDTLDAADRLRAEGTAAGKSAAQQIDYLVWQQFVGNHIARFNYEGLGREKRVRMFNAKKVLLSGSTFNGLPQSGASVSASNGTLHLLKGASPFAYNIYDYLSANPALHKISSDIKKPEYEKVDTLWERSPKGALNEYGQMVYIDTLINRYNLLLRASGADIRNEDSTYVALLPTNAAWQQAVEKVGKVYTYGSRYSYDWNGQGFQRNREQGTQYKLDGKMHSDPTRTLADSLREYAVQSNIIRNLFLAPYRIKGGEVMDSAALMHHVTHADSLIATGGLVFYNPAAKKEAPDANFNPTFAGLKPYRASNGYVFNMEEYRFDPAYTFVREISFLLSSNSNYYVAKSDNAVFKTGTTLRLTTNNHNKYRKVESEEEGAEPVYVGVEGDVEGDSYQRFEMQSERSDLTIDFRLPYVLSAAYRIKLIMVPSKINLDIVPDPETDTEVVKFDAEIIDDENRSSGKVTIDQTKGQFDQNKVNEIVLWNKYEFPKCYAGLPSNYVSFPRLRLTLPRKGRGPLLCKALNIVKVVVEPYRGE